MESQLPIAPRRIVFEIVRIKNYSGRRCLQSDGSGRCVVGDGVTRSGAIRHQNAELANGSGGFERINEREGRLGDARVQSVGQIGQIKIRV